MQILKSTKTKNNNTVSLLKSNISGEKNVLIIGGFHGDEPQGPALIDAYLENFDNGKNTVFVLPCLNPDGIAVNTPMIQDLRNMLDFSVGVFDAAKNEVIILAAVKLAAEAFDLVHNRLTHGKEVRNVVMGAQQIRVVIRLEVGVIVL